MGANPHRDARRKRDAQASVTVFVCVSCRRAVEGGETFERPGARALRDVLQEQLSEAGAGDITVTRHGMPRRLQAALHASPSRAPAAGPTSSATSIPLSTQATSSTPSSPTGAPATASCRGRSARRVSGKGVVARIPPLGFVQPEPESRMTSIAKVPCSIVTGFLGAGKTTLVRNVLAERLGAAARRHRQRVRRRRHRRRDPQRLRGRRPVARIASSSCPTAASAARSPTISCRRWKACSPSPIRPSTS